MKLVFIIIFTFILSNIDIQCSQETTNNPVLLWIDNKPALTKKEFEEKLKGEGIEQYDKELFDAFVNEKVLSAWIAKEEIDQLPAYLSHEEIPNHLDLIFFLKKFSAFQPFEEKLKEVYEKNVTLQFLKNVSEFHEKKVPSKKPSYDELMHNPIYAMHKNFIIYAAFKRYLSESIGIEVFEEAIKELKRKFSIKENFIALDTDAQFLYQWLKDIATQQQKEIIDIAHLITQGTINILKEDGLTTKDFQILNAWINKWLNSNQFQSDTLKKDAISLLVQSKTLMAVSDTFLQTINAIVKNKKFSPWKNKQQDLIINKIKHIVTQQKRNKPLNDQQKILLTNLIEILNMGKNHFQIDYSQVPDKKKKRSELMEKEKVMSKQFSKAFFPVFSELIKKDSVFWKQFFRSIFNQIKKTLEYNIEVTAKLSKQKPTSPHRFL